MAQGCGCGRSTTVYYYVYTATEIIGDFASRGNLPAEPDGRDPLDYRLQSVDRVAFFGRSGCKCCRLPSRGVSVKSGVHTTVGRFHTGSAGVAEVGEVRARFRGRGGAREKFESRVKKAGIHTEIADFTGLTRGKGRTGVGRAVDLPGTYRNPIYRLGI